MSDIKLLEGVLADAVDDIGHGHNPVDVIRNAIETAAEEEGEAREKAGARVAELEARWARLRAFLQGEYQDWQERKFGGSREAAHYACAFGHVISEMDRLSTPAEVVRVTVDDCDEQLDGYGRFALRVKADPGVTRCPWRRGDTLDIVRRKLGGDS